MSGHGPDDATGSQTSGLGWPLVVLGVAVLGSIVAVTLTGHDPSALTNTIGVLLSTAGAAGGLGAWIKSTQAAKQTNGVLDERMRQAVTTGIAEALADAAQARQPPTGRAPVRPATLADQGRAGTV